MTRPIRGAAVAVFLLVLAAVPAFAHAELEESDPQDGAIITTPYTLTASFSEEFDPQRSFIRVENVSGDVVAEGEQDVNEPLVMTADLPTLPPGEYTVRWQTTTPDDNGVERGTFTFDVAAAPTQSATQSPTSAPAPAPTQRGGAGLSGSGNDILVALLVGLVLLGGIGAYLYMRSRR